MSGECTCEWKETVKVKEPDVYLWRWICTNPAGYEREYRFCAPLDADAAKKTAHRLCRDRNSGRRKGGGCFHADTLVLTADGGKRKIGSLKEGDLVIGGSRLLGGVAASPIITKRETEHEAYCVVRLSNGEEFMMSDSQPLAMESGAVEAGEIVFDSRIRTMSEHHPMISNESPVTVSSVHYVEGSMTLHSIELQDQDYFFFGDALLGGGQKN